MTKEVLHENHVTTKKTGAPSSFVMDGVRVDMRRLSSHADARPTKADRPRPQAKKPKRAKAAKPAKTTPAE